MLSKFKGRDSQIQQYIALADSIRMDCATPVPLVERPLHLRH